ncbi:MAG: NADH-quinone oxidoreductase subunit M [Solirubrobacterales bacterium]|nr:NADH-quinone oxidoreductase subunit M [Solirubrobacterales bacterium]
MIQILLWLPLAAGLVACLAPRRLTPMVATAGALGALVLALALLADFDPNAAGLQQVVDESWIPDLGVRYQLGIDGISIFLVVMTTVLWLAATAYSAIRTPDRPKTYFLMMGLGQTATLGAFLAQDLLLFVLFFDLMLLPMYFLIGGWGEGEGRVQATIKMIVYTLVGSLLMLVGAVATAVLVADGGQLSFSMADLRANVLPEDSQDWIFWFFAAAFLVKMPAFLVHGWMSDAYRAAPLPVLVCLSGVLAKVGAYGFLRIVLPTFPDATVQFQEVLLVIALASILYGSVMAFTQTEARLIAGYSSIAQLGFITLGIFTLRPDAANGAVLQMVNHGLVVAGVFLIFAVISERTGSSDITKLGGLASRAPVLAVLFLIVTMATLAIPGSSNFIGETYILIGAFQDKVVYAVIAFAGVVMAAYYALRMYQRTMHNRLPDGLESREISFGPGVIIGGLVACIVTLAVYPNLILKRSDDSVTATVAAAKQQDVDLAARTSETSP